MHQCYALWLGNAEVVLLKHALAWKDHVPTIVSASRACTDFAPIDVVVVSRTHVPRFDGVGDVSSR